MRLERRAKQAGDCLPSRDFRVRGIHHPIRAVLPQYEGHSHDVGMVVIESGENETLEVVSDLIVSHRAISVYVGYITQSGRYFRSTRATPTTSEWSSSNPVRTRPLRLYQI